MHLGLHFLTVFFIFLLSTLVHAQENIPQYWKIKKANSVLAFGSISKHKIKNASSTEEVEINFNIQQDSLHKIPSWFAAKKVAATSGLTINYAINHENAKTLARRCFDTSTCVCSPLGAIFYTVSFAWLFECCASACMHRRAFLLWL